MAEPHGPPSPRPHRRRGADLEAAIHLATLEELARTSVAELTFERIATAARTGKAALYRRWSTPAELILAALTDPRSGFGDPQPPRTGALRDDLVVLLTRFARTLRQPRGRALRPLVAHGHQHPELLAEVQRQVIAPHQDLIREVVADHLPDGPGRVPELVIAVGPRTVLFETWARGPLDRPDVEQIVDLVVLPLLTPRA